MQQSIESKSVDLGNGETYSYNDSGDSKSKVLVLVHGNGSDKTWWDTFIPLLSDQFRVIAYDMRGFGDSTFKKPFRSLHDLADDLKLFCDKLSLKDIALLGWSTGGGVAMSFAAKYPDLISHMILHCSMGINGLPIGVHGPDMQPVPGKFMQTKEEFDSHLMCSAFAKAQADGNADSFIPMTKMSMFNGKNTPSDDELKRFNNAILKDRCMSETLQSLAEFNMSNEKNENCEGDGNYKNIKAKTLVIAGKLDNFVPMETTEKTVKLLGDLATLKVYEESGHACIIDYTDEVIGEIKKFAREGDFQF